MTAETLPICEQAAQVQRLDGRRVRLVGTYTPVPTLKKMPRPGRPRQEVDLGEVSILIEGRASAYDAGAADGEPALIALGTEVRAADEIARLRGRRISVEGTLIVKERAPARQAASQRPAPALHDPVELRLENG